MTGSYPQQSCGIFAVARCAVSATGDGEAFTRALFAHEIHARML